MKLHFEFVESSEGITDPMVQGINRLLPQLTANPRQLTREDFKAVVAKGHVLIARDLGAQGDVVGTACLIPCIMLTGKNARIEDVVVDQAARGHGIGRKLVEMLLAKAKALGLAHVMLTSNPSRQAANAMYQSIGFRRVETNVYRFDLIP